MDFMWAADLVKQIGLQSWQIHGRVCGRQVMVFPWWFLSVKWVLNWFLL